MKRLIQRTLLPFLIIVSSCHRDTIKVVDKKLVRTRVISLASEPNLQKMLDKIGFEETKNGRISRWGNELNTDSILMVLQADGSSYSYTFKVTENSKSGSFTNIVFKSVVDGIKAFYLTYEPDPKVSFNLAKFTGTVTSFDLDMKEIISQRFVDGVITSSMSKTGRTQGCQPTVSISSECSTGGETSTVTGLDLPCLYGTKITVMTLDYSGCIITNDIGLGGGLPKQYTKWSDGTFVPSQYFSYSSQGGGINGSGSAGNCGGDGISTLSTGADPNSCIDAIAVSPPTLDELNQLIIDYWEEEQIFDAQLKPCLQTILNDLKNLTNGSVAQIIQKFSGNLPGYNWEVKDGNLALPGSSIPAGETSPTYNNNSSTITTTFDTQHYLDATELSWARTMLHESIHAYLITYFAKNRPGFLGTYPQMVQDWGVLQNWNAVHHEEFARTLLTSIADALQEYGVLKGYNLSRSFYEDMSWAGLQGTTVFKNLPQADRTRILNTIAIELTAKDSQGNPIAQKGKKAGC